MATFGLIGQSLSHSFSERYFKDKFKLLGLAHSYHLFQLSHIEDLPELWDNYPDLVGFNITIPYKKAVLAYANERDALVDLVGASNTFVKEANGKWKAYNTDVGGFTESLKEVCQVLGRPLPTSAWVFGTGGASLAVQVGLLNLGISFRVVGRQGGVALDGQRLVAYLGLEKTPPAMLWVQTTPVGQYPDIGELLPLPYTLLSPANLAIDLIYNPAVTSFLQRCSEQGTPIQNGLHMLHHQAEAAWQLWKAAL